jgi:hypothetical protein
VQLRHSMLVVDERGRPLEAVERDRDGWILRMYSCRQRDGRVNTYVYRRDVCLRRGFTRTYRAGSQSMDASAAVHG